MDCYWSLVLVLFSFSPFVSGVDYSHTIYIHPSTGADSPDCLTANSPHSPCSSLTWVFQQTRSSSTHYVLSGGTHYLEEPSPPFKDLTFLAFTGNSSVVTCTDTNTGLAFINVINILFHDIKFENCSAVRNSTSKDFLNDTIIEFRVALYFYLCESINMSHVSVSYSPHATGVVVYDTNGTNTISHSSFSHNTLAEGERDYPGGGGFYVEFTYCPPGVLSCDLPTDKRNDEASYTFMECEFCHNRANNLDNIEEFTYIFPYKSDHQAFGRGGGLSLFIRGKASGINFTIDGSTFNDNTAVWGGGLLIELHDTAHGNIITVNNSKFYNNRCPYTTENGTAGGAIRLAHYVYGLHEDDLLPDTATRNSITVDNSTFLNNTALYGAGISASWAKQRARMDQLARIHILNSFFQSNVAKLGIAVHVDQFWMVSQGLMPEIWIENSKFDKNTDRYYHRVTRPSNLPFQVGYGTVCVTSSTVWFRGNISFTNSSGSALAVAAGIVNFNGSHSVFENNTANKGAAIALVGASVIEVGYGTKMVFRNNTATTRGGAINVVYISRENLVTDAKCFIRHVNPLATPDRWNVSMVFIDNREKKGMSDNSIYTTSLLPCSVLGGSGKVTKKDKIVCWEGWKYYVGNASVSCDSQISSDIGDIQYTGDDPDARNHVKAFPGWKFHLPVTARDELKDNVNNETIFTSTVNSSHDAFLIYGERTHLNGEELTTYSMSMETIGERIWYVDVKVDLQLCPPGFKPHEGVCVCANWYSGTMACNLKAREATLLKSMWMGMFDHKSLKHNYFVVGCPRGYCNESDTHHRAILLPNSSQALTEVLCAANRNGTLCGECMEGYGPSINSKTFDCINCTDINLGRNIAKYVASIYIPLVALFTILILFDIRLTTGPANAFILYCQVVSSNFGLDAEGRIPLEQFTSHHKEYLAAYTIPYGIFNLEFIEGYIPDLCFSTNFNTLTALCLDYCVALSPLVMIILVLVIYKIKGVCCSRFTLMPKSSKFLRKQKRSIGEALLPAFASFLLLSYTKFTAVSAYIVTTRPLTDENGIQHYIKLVFLAGQFTYYSPAYFPYLATAIFVFCTFVAIPPFLLLDYPLRGLEWVISKSKFLERFYPSAKIHILLDTFQGCFRQNMRFFAGLYFLFRLFINITYIFCSTWPEQFALQQIACSLMVIFIALCQPYKRKFLNYVDCLMFTNLALLNCISHYFFEVFHTNADQRPPVYVFFFQYVLVLLPLVYMLLYIAWSKSSRYHNKINNTLRKIVVKFRSSSSRDKQLDAVIKDDLSVSSHSTTINRIPSMEPKDNIDAFFERAEETNRYRPPSPLPVTIVGVRGDSYGGDASVRQTAALRDSGMLLPSSCTSNTGCMYGSTGVSQLSTGRSDSGNH